jgi:beta-phosphoglucomutase-like phosphatase (HAD superfamily)
MSGAPLPSANGREPYRAVVFDFDQVLVEWGDIKTEAFLELFVGYPQQREAIRAYHLQNVGETLMVGDGLADYQAAQAAGIDFLARITDENRELWSTLPVTGVGDLHEMRAWWEQQRQVKDTESDHDQRG